MAIVSLNPLAELYFHGRITREDSEELLRDGPNGKFLLRSREVVNAGLDIFIISVSYDGQALHYSVDRRPDGTYNIPGGKQFIGPVEIVRYHMTSQDGIKTLLTQPVNRPPELGAVVYWGLTTDIVEAELFQSGGLSREAAREEVHRIFANSSTNKPHRFREFLRQMQYSRSWFHGVAGREEAEQRLAAAGMKTGSFLIRRKKECFVLSVIHDRQFKHYLIRERQNVAASSNSPSPIPGSPVSHHSCVSGYGMDGGPMYSSLIELVHWYHAYSDGLPCALIYPCSNTPGGEEPSVQELSRNRPVVKLTETPKQISVVDDFLPSKAAEQLSPPPNEAHSRRIRSPPTKPDLITEPEPPVAVAKPVLDEELAKKLDAIALEISVTHPGQKPQATETNLNPNKILISVQRPAVAVRPTPVIPMCKPAAMPIPPDPPSAKEVMIQKEKAEKETKEAKETVEKPNQTASKQQLVTKRVIRLPQSLARKTMNTIVSDQPTVASTTVNNNGLSVSSRRQNEASNGVVSIAERATSPLKSIQNPSPRPMTPPVMPKPPQNLRTTLIFDTVQTFANKDSPVSNISAKDDWDEPTSGGDNPMNIVNNSVHKNGVSGNGHTNGNSSNGHSSRPPPSQNGKSKESPLHPEPLILQDSVTRLDPDWLEIHQTIGHGHFGTVLFGYLITPQNRIPVAIKSVRETESRCVENLIKEATTMSNLTHPNIITFFGVCYIETILLVMEYAPLGTLQKFIRANRNFPILRIVKLMIQVADAMRYLEKNKLVHRDLACRNVLLLSEDQAKVSDFGMSRALDVQRDYYKSQNVGKWPLKWYPPEAIYYWKFDSKTDVWSYGVTLWEATSYGARPYQGMDGWQVLKFIESGKRLDRPPACPPQLYCLMNECWKFKCSERPTFEEVLVTMLDIDCQLAANVAASGE